MTSRNSGECGKCEELPGVNKCTCGEIFCETCFSKHLKRNPDHDQRRERTLALVLAAAPKSRSQRLWEAVTSPFIRGSQSDAFKYDEAAKWFGLITKINENNIRESELAETLRLTSLLQRSAQAHPEGVGAQFPSIASFVGPTGAGKSVLIRSIIYLSAPEGEAWESIEAPVPGEQDSFCSTTGEVNLYPEPSSFGTKTPILLADCEGVEGSKPVATKHQKDWMKLSRRYRIQNKEGRGLDRSSIVKNIYPRFLYIFSDVICYVTRDQRSWASATVQLLEWSSIGAEHTINQRTLPALIIILNNSSIENEAWVSDDQDILRDQFFATVKEEQNDNDSLRNLTMKYGETSIEGLFGRNYSSVHIHYTPQQGYGRLGSFEIIQRQNQRLLDRIKSDSRRVQEERAQSPDHFDSRQIPILTELAFNHLATGAEEPFDFESYRRKTVIPHDQTLHLRMAEFFGRCFKPGLLFGMPNCVPTLGINIMILGETLFSKHNMQPIDDLLLPSTFFSAETQQACKKALEYLYDENLPCGYIDPKSGKRCVNTKSGHGPKGHQDRSGQYMQNGDYVEDGKRVIPESFINSVKSYITDTIEKFRLEGLNRKKWRVLATAEHRKNMERLRESGIYPQPGRAEEGDPFHESPICYGCLFRRPEYLLPCNHTVCEYCIRSYSDSTIEATRMKRATGKHILKSCVICNTSIGEGWPFEVSLRPPLSGCRVLSLDGGGVRVINQLVVLERLESCIGLKLPIGDFFDLIVGTSTGGIAAIALGIFKTPATEFTPKFKGMCAKSFIPQYRYRHEQSSGGANQASWLQYMWNFFVPTNTSTPVTTKFLQDPLYSAQLLERSFQDIIQGHEKRKFFGLRNHCRVAVTTTFEGESRFIANYSFGGYGTYLFSNMSFSDVALCTSACPPYFPPHVDNRGAYRDGGLKANNPIHLAATEAKALWAPRYDIILSVGSGMAKKLWNGARHRDYIGNDWVRRLFDELLNNINGNAAWVEFQRSWPKRVLERSERLNVDLAQQYEPAFDGLLEIADMEEQAKSYSPTQPHFDSRFQPIVGNIEAKLIETLADRLRASLFFLEVKSVNRGDGFTVSVKGSVRCRLGPGDKGFESLLSMVSSFKVDDETVVGYSEPSPPIVEFFGLSIKFSSDLMYKAVRIDVNFGKPYWVAISGCPITIEEIIEEWDPDEAEDEVEEKTAKGTF
ncbi:hypothetical protein EYR41_004922 [Orbilia oligospora]|uniref:PNPLA domain-containing protein n=1 Tax=Orbilia oligospora TaxID=2813651 RepID=A0A8H2HRQ1_ORBOL|nr:hypothetical protein EYR41_004922 [Orbilia oligospora]